MQPEIDAYNYYVQPGIEWKPVSSLTLNVGPQFARDVEDAMYVDTYDDPTATETYGKRYVFAHLDQKTLSANIRLNWAFTPRVSLQTFVQPLISSGAYSGYKALAVPRSYEFVPVPYGGNPNFNYVSLRGNAVFRWEYRPGSTLYLVWTQERSDNQSQGEFNFRPDWARLMNTDTNNIFLVKLSYYFTM